MRALFRILAVTALAVASQADAAPTTCALKIGGGGDVIVFKSREQFDACDAEKRVNGQPGIICLRAVAAMVPDGTQAQNLGMDGFASSFVKVRVLQGESAGAEGVVPGMFCKP